MCAFVNSESVFTTGNKHKFKQRQLPNRENTVIFLNFVSFLFFFLFLINVGRHFAFLKRENRRRPSIY